MPSVTRLVLVLWLLCGLISCGHQKQKDDSTKARTEATQAKEADPDKSCQSLENILQEYLDLANEASRAKESAQKKELRDKLEEIFRDDDKNNAAIQTLLRNPNWSKLLHQFRGTLRRCPDEYLSCVKATGMMKAIVEGCRNRGGIE